MDRLSKERRSWNMSRIRGQNTSPELLVRSLLHRSGFRFRLHRRDLPGRPDIVLPKHRTVVFVHGCFWHRHPRCRLAAMPKSRPEFWRQKFRENVRRDRRAVFQLNGLGWRVIVIWECETRDSRSLAELIARVLPGVPKRRTIADPPGVHTSEGRGNWGSKTTSRRPLRPTRRTSLNR
jgi:DNA mismatch endonuclease (patch repair protein)